MAENDPPPPPIPTPAGSGFAPSATGGGYSGGSVTPGGVVGAGVAGATGAVGDWATGGAALSLLREPAAVRLERVLRSPALVWNSLILLCLGVALAALCLWVVDVPKLAEGQVAPNTVLVRTKFTIEDRRLTESQRTDRRNRVPRVYVADVATLDGLRDGLENLPRAVGDAPALEAISPGVKTDFQLTPERLAALKAMTVTGADGQRAPAPAWSRAVTNLVQSLRQRPLVDNKTFTDETLARNNEIELRVGSGASASLASTQSVINREAPGLEEKLRPLVRSAGFPDGPAQDAVLSRLARLPATFKFDAAATAAAQEAAVKALKPVTVEFVPGQILVTRGRTIEGDDLELLRKEAAAYGSAESAPARRARDLALLTVGMLAALGLGAYVATYAPAIWRSPVRLLIVSLLGTLALAASCALAVFDPRLMAMALTTPVLLVTVMLAVAFDRATALATGSILAIITAIALEQPVVAISLSLCGVWVVVWRLRELRHRQSLIRAGASAAVALGLAYVLVAGVLRPLDEASIRQSLADAAIAAGGALFVGFLVLGLLPFVERLFDITTGMSLIELRDPSHPLLRYLQQRAPGTYNHSLNVATIAEAAADAVSADALLTYVGALYHDVGKANKPEYFVENQSGGPNRHDKLSPAISLLVIVGHVREGIELAKQHNLPRVLFHFIESHHGTTLVEYFFHRARKQAEAANQAMATTGQGAAGAAHGANGGPGNGNGASGAMAVPVPMPQEIEFRYGGPKPRTREAAILMICDAAESAARSLPEPTPARIDSLVRAIAHKRLMDGQFDHCDLTLRELNLIIESVTRALASIHHTRISYPDGAGGLPSVPRQGSAGRATGSGAVAVAGASVAPSPATTTQPGVVGAAPAAGASMPLTGSFPPPISTSGPAATTTTSSTTAAATSITQPSTR